MHTCTDTYNMQNITREYQCYVYNFHLTRLQILENVSVTLLSGSVPRINLEHFIIITHIHPLFA